MESIELPLQPPLKPASSPSMQCVCSGQPAQPGLQCLLLPRGPVAALSGLELPPKMLRAGIICALSGFKFQKRLSSTRCSLQPLLHGLKMV